jgi:hypothetical protein
MAIMTTRRFHPVSKVNFVAGKDSQAAIAHLVERVFWASTHDVAGSSKAAAFENEQR